MTNNNGPPSTSSRSSIFLTCFGYSGEKMQVIDKVNSTSRRRRWLSEWSFSCKKSEVKSVHVDFKPTHRKSKSLNETKHVLLTSEEPKVIKHVPTTSEEQKTCRKSWINVVKGQKSQHGSFRSHRKDLKPGATSAKPADTSAKPDATSARPAGGHEQPETKAVTVTNMKALTQSKSVPVVKQRQKATEHVEHKDRTTSGGELDSIMGMLILLVIMIIMMLWGKVCAIFCTCAWFFTAPRVMAAAGGGCTTAEKSPELVDNININNNINMESVEYKKKVVLEGLLQRNHRNNVVGRL